jgi:DNA-binding response OmpR family regulator
MAVATTVLLVEPRDVLREALVQLLTTPTAMVVLAAANVSEAFELIGGSHLDVVVAADPLPDMASVQFVADLRKRGVRGPVILIGTGPEAGDGAELVERLSKPFRFAALAARLRAQLRNFERSSEAVVRIGPYAFQFVDRLLTTPDREPIKLTDKEAAILQYLHRADGAAVSRETLLDQVWGYQSGVTTHTLETHIYRLRQKIEPVNGENTLLLTEDGGYRLISSSSEGR